MRLLIVAAMIAMLSGCAALPTAGTIDVLDRHTGKHYSCMPDPGDPLGGYCAPAEWPQLAKLPWPAALIP
jgi:hypothetical protein